MNYPLTHPSQNVYFGKIYYGRTVSSSLETFNDNQPNNEVKFSQNLRLKVTLSLFGNTLEIFPD